VCPGDGEPVEVELLDLDRRSWLMSPLLPIPGPVAGLSRVVPIELAVFPGEGIVIVVVVVVVLGRDPVFSRVPFLVWLWWLWW